jgi:hypothetical protein
MRYIRQARPGSASFNGSASIFARHLDSDDGALERYKSAVPVDIGITGGQALFRASFCSFRARQVNLRGSLGGLREHGDAVAQNFSETLENSEDSARLRASSAISELANPQLGHQRRVPRQYAEFTLGAWHHDLHDVFAQKLPLRRDDNQLDGFRKHLWLDARLHFFCLSEGLIDRADHVERLFRDVVVLAFDDFPEAADGIRNFYVFAFEPGELRGHEHGLR